jgi:hypothetical protein
MKNFWHRLYLMRLALGLFIVLDSYPLGFFFKEVVRVPVDSATFTAGFILFGLILMVPNTFRSTLYLPNLPVFFALVAFLGSCLLYAFMFNEVAVGERNKDMIYYAFVIGYLILLITLPNEVANEVAFVGAMFTLASNVALVYSLIIDPDWTLGQRAAIQYGDPGMKTGNPHVFARNAQIGLVCSFLWAYRPNQKALFKMLGIAMVIFNVVIILLTFSKAAILATLVTTFIYAAANLRHTTPARIKKALLSPISLIIVSLPFVAFFVLITVRPEIWDIITIYFEIVYDRFSENILALLGLEKEEGEVAEVDISSANRVLSIQYVLTVLTTEPYKLFMGFGYKTLYLDVPILEALINQGLIPFLIYVFIFYRLWKDCLAVAYRGGRNDMESLWTYCFFLFFASYLFAGRPYEMAVFHPLCLFARFINIYYPPEVSNVPEEVEGVSGKQLAMSSE